MKTLCLFSIVIFESNTLLFSSLLNQISALPSFVLAFGWRGNSLSSFCFNINFGSVLSHGKWCYYKDPRDFEEGWDHPCTELCWVCFSWIFCVKYFGCKIAPSEDYKYSKIYSLLKLIELEFYITRNSSSRNLSSTLHFLIQIIHISGCHHGILLNIYPTVVEY